MTDRSLKITEHTPGLFSCEAVETVLNAGTENVKRTGEVSTAIQIFICPHCDYTHMAITDGNSKMTYLHTFPVEAAETIGQRLINPPTLGSQNKNRFN